MRWGVGSFANRPLDGVHETKPWIASRRRGRACEFFKAVWTARDVQVSVYYLVQGILRAR